MHLNKYIHHKLINFTYDLNFGASISNTRNTLYDHGLGSKHAGNIRATC